MVVVVEVVAASTVGGPLPPPLSYSLFLFVRSGYDILERVSTKWVRLLGATSWYDVGTAF